MSARGLKHCVQHGVKSKLGASGASPETGEGSESEKLLFGGPLLYNARWADHHQAFFAMSLWAMALMQRAQFQDVALPGQGRPADAAERSDAR
ncbi:hypothetical protein [Streptomyces cinnamoneus]|uniref:hypothetical protein n=1 Tax=Streptomyces cinnamoneus TaxID=53446 RepID=UPI0015E41D13|nr:hypothetical protein [Streptomyces cinnamoneus]